MDLRRPVALAISLVALAGCGGKTAPRKYLLDITLSPPSGGAVTVDPDDSGATSGLHFSYECHDTSSYPVHVTAVPAGGFAFDHWQGACVPTNDPAATVSFSGGCSGDDARQACTAFFVATGQPMDGGIGDLAQNGNPDGMPPDPDHAERHTTGRFTGGKISKDDYIIVGANDSLATSPDGITWTLGSFGNLTGNSYTGVAASQTAANHYVAVGGQIVGVDGSAFYSPDAKTWTKATGPTLAYDVTWDGKQYLTIASYGGQLCTSPDGATWTCNIIAALANAYPTSIVFAGGLYFVLGYDKSQKAFLASSPDAVTWTAQPGAAAATNNHLASIAFANNLYVAGTVGGQNGPDILTSPDAKTWTRQPSATAMALLGGSGGFEALGWTGTWWIAGLGGNSFVVSHDAVNWQQGLPVANASAVSMTTGGPRAMVAVLSDGSVATVEQ
jgi:hypothetical protein